MIFANPITLKTRALYQSSTRQVQKHCDIMRTIILFSTLIIIVLRHAREVFRLYVRIVAVHLLPTLSKRRHCVLVSSWSLGG
jgi:hypothetical protein